MKFNEFIKKSKEVHLDPQAKERILHLLKTAVEHDAVRNKRIVRHEAIESSSILFIISRKLKYSMPIVLILAVLVSGGVSFAAQDALPGDALYPVKVSINERVQDLLAVSPEAKAEVAADQLNERLQEAARLAAGGSSETEVEVEVEHGIDRGLAKLRARIADLRSEGGDDLADEVYSDAEVSLAVHEEVLAALKVKFGQKPNLLALVNKAKFDFKDDGDDEKERVAPAAAIALMEDASASRFASATADLSATVPAAAAEGRIKAAENKLTELRRIFESRKARLSTEVQAEVSMRISNAEAELAGAKTSFAADAYGDAFEAAKRSHRLSQEAQVLIGIGGHLEIEFEFEHGQIKVKASGKLDDGGRRGSRSNDEDDFVSSSDDNASSSEDDGTDDQGGGNDDGEDDNDGLEIKIEDKIKIGL